MLPSNFTKLFEGFFKIKFGGVVGKITLMVGITVVALASLGWIGGFRIRFLVALLIFVLTTIAIVKVIKFANANPQAALFEGAQFLAHERLVHASKSAPELQADTGDRSQPKEVQESLRDQQIALQPDEIQLIRDHGETEGNQ